MLRAQILYEGNSMLVELDQLYDHGTDDYVNDATVSVTLYDALDELVAGETWPKAMAYEAGSDGKYIGMLSPAINVTPGETYTAIIQAVRNGVTGKWAMPLECKDRTR